MDTSNFAPLIIIIVIVITMIFAGLRRLSGVSSRSEIENAHISEALSATVQHESRTAKSDEELADRLLPSHCEAMILPLGRPMEREHATFEGTLLEARKIVATMTIAEQAHIAIWTPGHIFTAGELLAEAPGHEHDPLAPLA